MSPRAIDTEEISSASVTDPELQRVRKCIAETLTTYRESFQSIARELCVANNIVLRGKRNVLPKALRTRAITIAHQDHARIIRCKQRLRSKLWWPGMDQDSRCRNIHHGQMLSLLPSNQSTKPTPIQSTS